MEYIPIAHTNHQVNAYCIFYNNIQSNGFGNNAGFLLDWRSICLGSHLIIG